jgi:hypothetical protein
VVVRAGIDPSLLPLIQLADRLGGVTGVAERFEVLGVVDAAGVIPPPD